MEHTGLFLSLIQRRKWPTIELTCFRGERPVSDELTAARAGRFSELLCPHLADCVRSAEFRTSVIHRHLAATGEMGIRLRVQAVMPCLLQGEFARGRRLASADYCRGQGWCSYCGGVGMEAGEFYQAAQVVIAIVAASRRPRCGERHARQLPAAANGSQQVQERHGAGLDADVGADSSGAVRIAHFASFLRLRNCPMRPTTSGLVWATAAISDST